MAKIVIANAPVGGFYGETRDTTTTRRSSTIPPGTKEIQINSEDVFRVQLGPPLVLCCKTADDEVTFTDYTSAATDKSTSTSVVLSSLSTAANGDYWYVGCKFPFGGVWVDVDSANGTASACTGYYWNGAWTDISLTDGAGGATTLASDGPITWAIPSSWRSAYLRDLFPKATLTNLPIAAQTEKLFVVRFQVVTALDSSTTLDEVATLQDATAYPPGYMKSGTDYLFAINRDEVGSLEIYGVDGGKTVTTTYIKESIFDQ